VGVAVLPEIRDSVSHSRVEVEQLHVSSMIDDDSKAGSHILTSFFLWEEDKSLNGICTNKMYR